jgi:hypothetical protein
VHVRSQGMLLACSFAAVLLRRRLLFLTLGIHCDTHCSRYGSCMLLLPVHPTLHLADS